jgi:hypothetical protein
MKLVWRGQRLEGAALKTWREVTQVLGDRKMPIYIEDVRWAWPRDTVRKKGKSIAGSPRNIVDTSQLLQSQEPTEWPAPNVAVFRNSAEYAMAVHEGAAIASKTGVTVLPPRPWMTTALEEFDLPKAFADLFKVYAGGAS